MTEPTSTGIFAKLAPAFLGALLSVLEGEKKEGELTRTRITWGVLNFFASFGVAHFVGRWIVEWRGIADPSATADMVVVFCGFAGLAIMRRAREQIGDRLGGLIDRITGEQK